MTYQINVQWKGTDVCLDFNCPCGQFSHIDGFTFSYIKCFACGQNYKLASEIPFEAVDESETVGGGLIDVDQLDLIKGEK